MSSLIPQKVNKENKEAAASGGAAAVGAPAAANNDQALLLDLDKIGVNPMQPRRKFSEPRLDELVESVRRHGIIQPVIVSLNVGGRYELIAGERRLRAARILGLKKVPAIIRGANEREKLEVALVENLQREDLNPVETALAYRRLIDEFNLRQEDISKRVGRSRSSVSNALRILNLPEAMRTALADGKISEGHAKILSGMEEGGKQMVLFKKILHTAMSVEDAAKESRRMGGTKQARIKINYADKDKEFAFREFFGSKAEIKRKGRGGQIVIYFYSDEELGAMAEKIKN